MDSGLLVIRSEPLKLDSRALHLAMQCWPEAEREAQLKSLHLLTLEGGGGFLLLAARREWNLVGAILAQLLPGKAATLWPAQLDEGVADAAIVPALVAAVLATLSFTLGTIWQKRTKPDMDLRVNAAIQFIGAAALTAPLAFAFESNHFDGSPALLGALAWAVLGLSVGGISILLVLLERGAASKVAPLLYLAPAVSAFMALALFGEALAPVQIAGMMLAVIGAFTARS